jgi:hypothetical protein
MHIGGCRRNGTSLNCKLAKCCEGVFYWHPIRIPQASSISCSRVCQVDFTIYLYLTHLLCPKNEKCGQGDWLVKLSGTQLPVARLLTPSLGQIKETSVLSPLII